MYVYIIAFFLFLKCHKESTQRQAIFTNFYGLTMKRKV